MANDRPKAGDIEERNLPDLLAADSKKIRGKIPYGTESRDLGGWREVIERGALERAALDDLVVTVDHAGVPLGRYPGTLELEDREDGLHWSVDPPAARAEVREAVERGDLRAGSWRMVVARDEWRGDVRHVHEIAALKDVAVVTSPAYPAAEVELRSHHESNPGAAQEDKMGDQPEIQTTTTEPAVEDRSNTTTIPAGSLRVEDRAELAPFQTLADLYAHRGFFENRTAQATWDEWRSFTWSAGTVLTDLNPNRVQVGPLGYDSRWLYPVVPTTGVDTATTSVQYLQQSARTLAAGTAVIRALDATSTKPETSSTVELKTLQLSQVATVSSGIPRIHAAQPMFQSVVEQDLRLAVNDGLDELVRRGVATAGTAATVTGDILEKTRKAITVVQASGYSPRVLAIDPAGAQALDLLRSSGSEALYLWGAGQGAPGGPFGLQLRVWKTAGTAILDPDAFGRLYVAPIELRSFEADGGLSNKQNVRMETHAGFAVERTDAALRIL